MSSLPDYIVKNFSHGTITRFEKESLPKGAARDSLNWLTLGDHIELRRGMQLMGTEVSGTGAITGLKVGARFDGTQVLFRTRAQKLEYYNETTDDWAENGSDLLGSAASGEDVSMDTYHHISGAFMFVTSLNSDVFQVPLANPGSAKDLNSTSHKGKMRIKQNRMFLWDRKDTNGGRDQTGIYGSYIDKDELSDYTETTNENVGTGNGTTTTFTGTLAAITSVKTCMYVRINDGTETFTDDRNGVLVGSLGGTGTINYATGAFSVTFNTAPTNLQAILANYYTADAKSAGIADFSKSTPRTAGQGFTFRQDDGGAETMNLGTLGNEEYCFHKLKTWVLTLTADDTDATNFLYRQRVGIPYWRGLTEGENGLYYVDNTRQNNAYVRILKPGDFSTNIIPESISDILSLEDYRFDKAMLFLWNNYLVLLCRHKDSTVNNTTFLYNLLFKTWDRLDYRLSVVEEYNGALWGGDSASNNVFELFNGVSDEESAIVNYWISGKTNLDVEGVKRFHRFVIAGLIAQDQELAISFSYDNGAFVEVGTIEGDGAYVDLGAQVTIGSQVLGRGEIGGGSAGITASPYRREFTVATDKFENIEIKFEATEVGYVSVSEYQCKDIRYKGRKLATKYVV